MGKLPLTFSELSILFSRQRRQQSRLQTKIPGEEINSLSYLLSHWQLLRHQSIILGRTKAQWRQPDHNCSHAKAQSGSTHSHNQCIGYEAHTDSHWDSFRGCTTGFPSLPSPLCFGLIPMAHKALVRAECT